jgi:hypothetical protein
MNAITHGMGGGGAVERVGEVCGKLPRGLKTSMKVYSAFARLLAIGAWYPAYSAVFEGVQVGKSGFQGSYRPCGSMWRIHGTNYYPRGYIGE